jgi:predicted Fe-S protein YdhL (DUF1289 family)
MFAVNGRICVKTCMIVESPCTRVCVMDPASGLCRGCGRTITEIGDWSSLRDAEREAIAAALPGRMRAAGLGCSARPADPASEP